MRLSRAAMKLILALTAVLAGLPACLAADAAPAQETPAERDARMEWFRDARFGMFIHWGVYSVPAGEWKGNKSYGEWFLEETKMPVSRVREVRRAVQPGEVRRQAVGARSPRTPGMKYIVITSKHHDGFGMYRSELTDWCIKSTPFQRDPLKELAAACKEAGHHVLLLPLDHGLASSRLGHAPGVERQGHRPRRRTWTATSRS